MGRHYPYLTLVAAAAALAWLPSCEALTGTRRQVPHYRSAGDELTNVRRVVMLPFADEAGAGTERETVERAFMREFEKATSIEIVRVDGADVEYSKSENPRRSGKYNIEKILDLAIRYGADAVLFTAITTHRAFPPQRLGLRHDLVSTNSGLTIWSCNAMFDMADADSRSTLENTFAAGAARSTDSLSWASALASPASMAALVAREAVSTLVK